MSEKTRFIERMKSEMSDLETRIDHLKVEAALGKMEAREDIEAFKQKLRAKLRPLRSKLAELSEESDEAWDDLAEGFTDAWSDVKSGVRNAVSKYRS